MQNTTLRDITDTSEVISTGRPGGSPLFSSSQTFNAVSGVKPRQTRPTERNTTEDALITTSPLEAALRAKKLCWCGFGASLLLLGTVCVTIYGPYQAKQAKVEEARVAAIAKAKAQRQARLETPSPTEQAAFNQCSAWVSDLVGGEPIAVVYSDAAPAGGKPWNGLVACTDGRKLTVISCAKQVCLPGAITTFPAKTKHRFFN